MAEIAGHLAAIDTKIEIYRDRLQKMRPRSA